ncbi:MAG: lipid-A-disaccharide synthase [Alphaproteobacteria bacterium]|nr:lipid-A-disaccharide synthase [Alphaproteobacteria bacterium]MCB9699510.1 lipid-A-disaccharide synthase [Alphaproteobacteria bacterium]
MARIVVAAAEASGDALAAAVVRELRDRRPDLRFSGAAGPHLRAAGVRAVARAEDLSAVGLVEAIGVVPAARRALTALEAELHGSAACLTVDAPSLLLRLARRARRAGVPALHLVAPQVWAWRPGRADRVADTVDTLMCLLPFEPPLFEGRVRAIFVGHPAAATAPIATPIDGRPTFALCPGSRPAEVRRLWPVFREVARALRRRWPESAFVVPRAPTLSPALLGGLDARLVDRVAACAHADAALVASGTATLELAALDVPMVVAYQVHPLTAIAARRWLRVPRVALPNVLAGRALVPEHLQDLDPARIAADLERLVGTGDQVPRALLASLRGEGAVRAVADEVLRWL